VTQKDSVVGAALFQATAHALHLNSEPAMAQALLIWMSRPEWKPITMTAEQLNHELVRIAHSKSMGETSWDGKAQYLGIRLQR
jgi:hypothetical protein